MKRLLCAIAALGLGAPVLAADVGVSVRVGQPGFYGRIDIGNYPAPQLLYAEPIVIQPVPVGIVRQPIYLRVPPGHAKNWRKHCHRYNACGQPVYFVQDNWYNDVYVPRYRGSHYAAVAPVPLAAPANGYRPQPQERVYVVPVSSVRAVVGAPEQRCWVERQQVVEDRSDVNVPGAIAGAVIGGVLGHQVGGGRGKDIATAGGAVAGAAIGANVGRGGSQVYSQDVQRCANVDVERAPSTGMSVQLPRRAASRAIERASRPDDYRECIRGTERVAASRSPAAALVFAGTGENERPFGAAFFSVYSSSSSRARLAADPVDWATPSFVARSARVHRCPSAQHDEPYDHAARQQQERSEPQQVSRRLDGRLVQHEVAVARDEIRADLVVALAGDGQIPHLLAQVLRERRVGVGERLVLAHEAAQLVLERLSRLSSASSARVTEQAASNMSATTSCFMTAAARAPAERSSSAAPRR